MNDVETTECLCGALGDQVHATDCEAIREKADITARVKKMHDKVEALREELRQYAERGNKMAIIHPDAVPILENLIAADKLKAEHEKHRPLDIRTISRADRRRLGFRGPVTTPHQQQIAPRFVRRHLAEVPRNASRTRRQRRMWARIQQKALKDGLV